MKLRLGCILAEQVNKMFTTTAQGDVITWHYPCSTTYYKAQMTIMPHRTAAIFCLCSPPQTLKVYPYQVAAVMFALRSPDLKGSILCDEGSLVKIYEAMLVITQLCMRENRASSLLYRLRFCTSGGELSRINLPCHLFVMDSQSAVDENIDTDNTNAFLQDGIILTTYDFATERADNIVQIK